jgi:Protein of unknown function (DUF3443)
VIAGNGLGDAAARALRFGLCAMLCLAVLSCGGGGNSTSLSGGSTGSTGSTGTTTAANNVVDVVVDAGPSAPSSAVVNTLYTTVTVCVPGSTTSCATIDHIEVDTGSFGLRLISSALGSVSLPLQTLSNGNSLLECAQFVDGYSWGPVALADVRIAGETASSVPVEVIGGSSAPVPSDCSSKGPAEDTVLTFGANGVLGVGVFPQDCGATCVTTVNNQVYYACTSTQCEATTVASASDEVADPVTYFATDNNGVIITLASVPATGSASVSGTMTFGIDTQSNNASGSQAILTVDGYGAFTTAFNGQSLQRSFLDTGSNALFFDDSSIPTCSTSSDFFCPTSTVPLNATLTGQNDISVPVDFNVANADTLFANATDQVAFVNLAGPYPMASGTATFDWGLPFYYGKTVFTAFDGGTTSVGTGPYVAF